MWNIAQLLLGMLAGGSFTAIYYTWKIKELKATCPSPSSNSPSAATNGFVSG